DPGPACYGFGGPLTVTDANLLAGRIIPEHFPSAFGPDRRSPLAPSVTERMFTGITAEINQRTGTSFTPEETALGFLRIANERMAMAIKEVSIVQGADVRDYALVCFGGAGGQHACSLASLLEMDRVIIHPLGSVMSAYGIGLARTSSGESRTILTPFTASNHVALTEIFRALKTRTGQDKGEVSQELDLRPTGTEAYLTLGHKDFAETLASFKEEYAKRFGIEPPDEGLEIVNARVTVKDTDTFFLPYREKPVEAPDILRPLGQRKVHFDEGAVITPVYLRDALPSGVALAGPALIIDQSTSIVVEPSFEAEMEESGILVLKRKKENCPHSLSHTGKADPVLLEVFHSLFMGIATEMGITLQKTAHSVNMKERLDFSCALFDAQGRLVANAPHIPVHLGAMSDTVMAIREEKGSTMRPGDLYLSNNPYRGGSHLPDMTVVCPVFSDEGRLIFFTAARGHHSDVGGITPGSMPPSAAHIEEEGVLIDNFLLVRDGLFREEELKALLLGHKHPARNLPERIADFRAQIAACHRGMKELQQLIGRYGLALVLDYMGFIQKNAEEETKRMLLGLLKGEERYLGTWEDRLDDGTIITASLTIEGGPNPPETVRALTDFTGTGSQHRTDNLNAPLAVTRSAVMYCLRSLIGSEIPLNSGTLAPIRIICPEGTILNPLWPAPVASGNVETSQRVVDVILGCLGAAAASQGTMNNLLFEVEGETPYYETIGGGSGATAGCAGASGVQVHMTNTRMTDPEVLELRHPGVRIERFMLRQGSGGEGKLRGGEGIVRAIKFLKPASVSILSERRVFEPYGLNGGEPGMRGKNTLKKPDGALLPLGSRAMLKLDTGDALIIETPGGGGFGKKGEKD
ncbi:MAG: 5-oxoprolinase, partial [Nitrospirales bacterium]|nr:5-oxoprolinase [Nitrospirales bacterium]